MVSGWNDQIQQEIIDRAIIHTQGSSAENYIEELYRLNLLPEFLVHGLNLSLKTKEISPSIRLKTEEADWKVLMRKSPRYVLLEQSKTSQKLGIICIVLADLSEETRIKLAHHPTTPHRILSALLFDFSFQVRVSAAKSLARTSEGLSLVLTHYVKTAPPIISVIALLHPQTPASLLSEMAAHVYASNWLLRYAIAQHPNTPSNHLSTLTNDSNPKVREIAKTRLLRPKTA